MYDQGISGTLPGAERNYVYVPTPFSLDGWFDAFRHGKTFVTNGPMLTFAINGKGIGSELRLKSGMKLTIEATASINPDIDALDSIELIEQGVVVKTVKAKNIGETQLRLHHETTARHGTWFVVRAKGKVPVRSFRFPEWDARQGLP
jgi:hypothetical protein